MKKEFSFELRPGPTGLGLFTTKEWAHDEVVFSWPNIGVVAPADFRTVQISQNSHILEPRFLRYLNHSCNPNIFIDVQNRHCQSLRTITAGEELRFFYPSTEWELSRPFQCYCHASRCLGAISGAKTMDQDALKQYRVNKHILSLKTLVEAP